MPELTPYDDPQVEAAIQQIMRQSNVDRRTAIQMYKGLVQQPGGRATDSRLGGMLSILGQAATPSIEQPIQPRYAENVARQPTLEDSSAESEGVDSPEVAVVAESDQANLAPGDERVTGASEQQGNVNEYGMGQLLSGGEMIYGQPVTKVSEAEKRAGLLQALATAGASYFGGRDIKAANRQAAERTASANLINALAGNIVAQPPRITPRRAWLLRQRSS